MDLTGQHLVFSGRQVSWRTSNNAGFGRKKKAKAKERSMERTK